MLGAWIDSVAGRRWTIFLAPQRSDEYLNYIGLLLGSGAFRRSAKFMEAVRSFELLHVHPQAPTISQASLRMHLPPNVNGVPT